MTAGVTGAERRAEPRLPLGLALIVRTRDSAVAGRTVDVSLGGAQVELLGPLGAAVREVGVELPRPGAAPVIARAVVVRRALTREGRSLIALRLVPGSPPHGLYGGPPLTSTAPVAARRGEGSREEMGARRQLKALAARVLELALEDGGARPPAAMVAWVGRLAAELGVDAPADVSDNRALFRGIAAMHRGVVTRAGAGRTA